MGDGVILPPIWFTIVVESGFSSFSLLFTSIRTSCSCVRLFDGT